MQVTPRIPPLFGTSFEESRNWFIALRDAGLLFNPDDDPADIVYISSGERMFTDAEVEDLRGILDCLFGELGEQLYEAGYPAFMEACGLDPYPEGG